MRFQLGKPPLSSVLASALAAAGIALAVAACSGHVTPLGPDAAATAPQPHRLGSPIVLQAMVGRPATPAGGCPAGYVTLSGPAAANSGQCFRKLGTPVTITSAAVSSSQPSNQPSSPKGQQAAPAALLITLPAADWAELTAVTTKAYDAKGYVDISVAGQTWGIPESLAPLTGGQFELGLPTKSQTLQLQHILVPSA